MQKLKQQIPGQQKLCFFQRIAAYSAKNEIKFPISRSELRMGGGGALLLSAMYILFASSSVILPSEFETTISAPPVEIGIDKNVPSSRPEVVKKTYVYKQVGDLAIRLDVYYPDDYNKLHPTLVWIHGGALRIGDRTGINKEVKEIFLNAGYVLISLDYRLAYETKLEEIVKDVEDAFRWIHEKGPSEFPMDPNRVAVMGGSAGGYLALIAGFRVEPLPQVVVSLYGYGDLTVIG